MPATNQTDGLWSPTQNRYIPYSEVQAFMATNPSQQSILSAAQSMGLTQQDLNSGSKHLGMNFEDSSRLYNTLAANLGTGGYGYSTGVDPFTGHSGTDTDQRIVQGGGNSYGNGSGTIFNKPQNLIFGPGGLGKGNIGGDIGDLGGSAVVGGPGTSPGGQDWSKPVANPFPSATTQPLGPLTQVGQQNPIQPGVTAGPSPTTSPSNPWGNTFQPNTNSFNTPVLNSLYSAQQQRMTTPTPSFNFQSGSGSGGSGGGGGQTGGGDSYNPNGGGYNSVTGGGGQTPPGTGGMEPNPNGGVHYGNTQPLQGGYNSATGGTDLLTGIPRGEQGSNQPWNSGNTGGITKVGGSGQMGGGDPQQGESGLWITPGQGGNGSGRVAAPPGGGYGQGPVTTGWNTPGSMGSGGGGGGNTGGITNVGGGGQTGGGDPYNPNGADFIFVASGADVHSHAESPR